MSVAAAFILGGYVVLGCGIIAYSIERAAKVLADATQNQNPKDQT